MVAIVQRLEYWVVSPGVRFQDPLATLMRKSTWKLSDAEIKVLIEAINSIDSNKMAKEDLVLLYTLKARFEASLNN